MTFYISTLPLDRVALKVKIVKLEAEHLRVKDQLFEMESKLLKCISDNKQYIVRKIKELSHSIKLNGKVSTCMYVDLHIMR